MKKISRFGTPKTLTKTTCILAGSALVLGLGVTPSFAVGNGPN
ncbi:hypothetical protein [Glutamicibacter ardleyensis]|jgi:hypothetical protein